MPYAIERLTKSNTDGKHNMPKTASGFVQRHLKDLLAGCAIAGLLLPEAVAYANIGNVPAQAGVVALIAGLVLYGVIGNSRYAVVSSTSSSAAVLAAVTLSAAGGDAAVTAAGPKSEVVLVVEDDPDVRKLVLGMVESLGYRTIAAIDGPSALEALARVGRVDLLFTDVVLPRGMNGSALAKAAQERQAGLKVLYMSGYTRNAILHNGALDEGVQLLTKPFRKADLAQKLHEVLNTTPG